MVAELECLSPCIKVFRGGCLSICVCRSLRAFLHQMLAAHMEPKLVLPDGSRGVEGAFSLI